MPESERRASAHSVFGVVHLLALPADAERALTEAEVELQDHQPPAVVLQPHPSMDGDDVVGLQLALERRHPTYHWQIRIDGDGPDLFGQRWSHRTSGEID